MRTFYRIETLNMDEDYSVGGYMAAVDVLLCKKLGIEPGYTAEELQDAVAGSKDLDVKRIMGCFSLLCDIPIPEIYKKDQDNMYCLYVKDEFEEAAGILNGLWDVMVKVMPAYSFRYKTFRLKDSEIAYEDLYQVVITKEVYEKHINDSRYCALPT